MPFGSLIAAPCVAVRLNLLEPNLTKLSSKSYLEVKKDQEPHCDIKDLILYNRPTIYSKPLANIETGRLLLVSKCKDNWCKVKSGKYSGWIKNNEIWGRL